MHRFPDSVKDKICHDKWVYLLKRKNFKPSSYSRLCSKHFIESDYLPPVISGPLRLKKDAVPSVFDLPDHLFPEKPRERRPLVRIIPNEIQPLQLEIIKEMECSSTDIGVKTTITSIELAETLSELRREKKSLQEQLRRRNTRVSNLNEMIQLSKNNALLSENVEGIIRSNLHSTLPFELFVNEIDNSDRSNTNRRYSDDIKNFCLTLYFYAPKAYKFIRKWSTLPHESTIRRWLSTRECKPGILTEVIEYLKEQTKSEYYLQDVALTYDAMAIRAGRWYSKKEDKFYGYCDLGGIANEDSEEYATEALFYVLVSYTRKFKVPVAYFLINKIDATLQSSVVVFQLLKNLCSHCACPIDESIECL